MELPALPILYARYETLSGIAREPFSGSLAGKLLLRAGLERGGIASLVAASVAGACSLCVDADAASLRAALRAGLCDFVVGPLDEALRILKNELRRGEAVSVGLTAEPERALGEMIDRGLQPDLISIEPGDPAGVFLERGALALPESDRPSPGTALLAWTLATEAARSIPQVARLAAQALEPSRPDTPARQRWLHSAPRQLGRAFAGRLCVRMTPCEAAAFLEAARAQFPALEITREDAAP